MTVVYPPTTGVTVGAGDSKVIEVEEGFVLQSRDSAFVFGSVGRGDAELRVNGVAVEVHPRGGWIAWLPLPDDSLVRLRIEARAGSETAIAFLRIPLASRYEPPRSNVWIDSTSFTPVGDLWVRPGEGTRLTLRAAPGAEVTGVLSDGMMIRFAPDTAPDDLPWGERAFGTEPPRQGPKERDRYVAWWPQTLGPDPGLVLAPNFPALPKDSLWMRIRAVVRRDTAIAIWPVRLGLIDGVVPTVVVLNDDRAGRGDTDGIVVGRPSASGTYHWFFPNGTVAVVSGRRNDQVRLQLSRSSVAWVSIGDVYPLIPGTAPPGGTLGSMRLRPGENSVSLRIPLSNRVPFLIRESRFELSVVLYGVAANADWIQYGGTDPLVDLISFAQPAEDEAVVTLALSQPVWGYRSRWDGTDLIVEVRRPPEVDPRRPLAGRVIAIDPGHPPAGARGPTGLWEPDIVLPIALKTAQLLERYGARVVLTRDTDDPVGLIARPLQAQQSDADVLVSIHANALPDGVNPFVNNGTSVYYFHPRSAPLARELQRALVRQFGFRDLGIGRGNLALVRPTWMPSALTEGLFMMIPEQEAVLASEEGQWRYARGIVEGIAAFLKSTADEKR
ncbi:MAG: N-acetylmuramoyl-L-alanine amidase [Gemmatimonadota bacterium]|nr:MAG: N-acetylmuramoyl-L-alanine amidase [Gemmatimonadota bacterium]